MQVQFNDQAIETHASTLSQLLEENGLSAKTGIAVAVNDRVVQRSQWDSRLLQQNDVILVITAAAGG